VLYTAEDGLLGRRFDLGSPAFVVGGEAGCDIVLSDPVGSRCRVRIEIDPLKAEYLLVVERAVHPVLLNDEPVLQECRLNASSRIVVGRTGFVLLVGDELDARYAETIYRLTICDELAGVHNARYFREALEREILRARRHNRALSVIVLDLAQNPVADGIQEDALVRRAARALSGKFRRDEVLARYDRWRFAGVLPETSKDKAARFAGTLVERLAMVQDGGIRAAIGVAALEPSDSPETLVQRAKGRLLNGAAG
jgi:diguanylate cyclase (GGDEF)-like protein